MGKLNVSVHPLFFLFGLYFAATGKVFSFIVFTLSAVIHEMGHAFVSEKLGYRLKKITLMPYGAVISGDISGLKYRDELKIVIAGPLVNLTIAAGLVACWWIFPETYPYTELAATANFSLFLINLLPAYPLDGGRLLLATLSLKTSRKKALKIARVTGYAAAGATLILFAVSLTENVNISILFFSLFILFGAADMKGENSYVSICEGLSPSMISKGKEIKTVAVNADFTVKKLYSILRDDCLYRVFVYKADGSVVILEPSDVAGLMKEKSLYDKII